MVYMVIVFLGVRKRVAKVAARKVSFHIAGKWIPAIIDHLYYVVAHSEPGSLRQAWWKSVTNHIVGIHVHDYQEFPNCRHGPDKPQYNDEGEELVVGYIEKGKFTETLIFMR